MGVVQRMIHYLKNLFLKVSLKSLIYRLIATLVMLPVVLFSVPLILVGIILAGLFYGGLWLLVMSE